MHPILVDNIANISLHSGILRIECMAVGPDGQEHASGALIIPGAVAGPIIQKLVDGMQQLEKKIREQQLPTAGSA